MKYVTNKGMLWKLTDHNFQRVKSILSKGQPPSLDHFGQYMGKVESLNDLFATIK